MVRAVTVQKFLRMMVGDILDTSFELDLIDHRESKILENPTPFTPLNMTS
jgi:hypothetical protein